MRVLCIKDSPDFAHTRNGIISVSESLRVKCGEVYTVAEEVTGYKGEKRWRLEEKPANCRYSKGYFSPLDNLKIDEFEVELVENINK